MKNKKEYLLGLDYGTLSVRCVISDKYGRAIADASVDYPHGVMDRALPSGTPLPKRYALQHPGDYIPSAKTAIEKALAASSLTPNDIVGMGIDFTACTMMAVDDSFAPLCESPEFENDPHAYVKLWKHYGAEEEAKEINALARERNEEWIKLYGGCLLPEWMLPKVLETYRRSPKAFKKAHRFLEAAEWVIYLITGRECTSSNFAGYKWQWNERTGYPSDDFLKELSPDLVGLFKTKITPDIIGAGELAGYMTKEGAALLGLCEGIAVASPYIDAHAAMPALGMHKAGELMLILGTSGVHIINTNENKIFEGHLGCVKDSYVPGLYTYEAGQAAVGDIFAWFTENSIPAAYEKEASERGISIHTLLTEKASELKIGESGLVALDWLNGNRTPLADPALTSAIVGLNIGSRPEEIYRAWLESSAYGSRSIIETFEKNGVAVNRIVVAGGIALKNELFMQIYADVLGKRLEISNSNQAGALGSCAFGAVAAGIYPDVRSASEAFAQPISKVYEPIPENHKKYTKLYNEYVILQNYFAKGENDVMKRLLKYKQGEI